ncbi:MAG: ABC transporter ATP-binding protein [Candidatus Bathyarchaeia archaeon]
MQDNPLIELLNVSKSYGPMRVLRDVSLKVYRGDFISIRGKSGAGKTTLLKIMGLIERPDCGKVWILGREANKLSDDEMSKIRLHDIGFIFQFFNLIPSLTVIENIELPLALAGVKREERRRRTLTLLEHFGLKDMANRFPSTLSGGERQRVAIARALINNPKIILADEPTSSLDEENSRMVIEMLERVKRESGVAIVLTTTDVTENIPANRNYMLKDGILHKYPSVTETKQLTHKTDK